MKYLLVICISIVFPTLLAEENCQELTYSATNSHGVLPKRWINSVGIEFVLIPPGIFMMGEGTKPPQGPQHKVMLTKPYYIARFPLTKGQYRLFRDEKKLFVPDFGLDPAPNQDYWTKSDPTKMELGYFRNGPSDRYLLPEGPLTIGKMYVEWLNSKEQHRYRLPTEAEWFWACYGGEKHAWFRMIGGGTMSFPEMYPFAMDEIPEGMERNTFGLGRIGYEWTADWYADFRDETVVDPKGPPRGEFTVFRDGITYRQPKSDRRDGVYRLVCEIDDDFTAQPIPTPPTPPEQPITQMETMLVPLGKNVFLEMRHLPAGDIVIGRPRPQYGPETREWPATPVHIPKDFWMGTYEVTQKQFETTTGYNPSYFKGDDRPVENMTWSEILEFLGHINTQERNAGRLGKDEEYRLPTEPEWEYACRAGTTTEYPFGDDVAMLPWYAVYDQYDVGTSPVGTKRPNPWGFHDMLGNVMELTWEMFGGYPGKPVTDPFERSYGPSNISGAYCWAAVRGGAWNQGSLACRSTWRRGMHVGKRAIHLGFRIVRGQIVQPVPMPKGWKPIIRGATTPAIQTPPSPNTVP